MDRTYEFTNETTIPYLMLYTYSNMDVAFANPMQYLRLCI